MKLATIEAIKALTDPSNPRHLDGWCSLDKALAMCDQVEKIRPSVVVELGVFGGRSMIPIALQLRDNGHGVIYGLDPWTNPAALEGEHKTEDYNWWAKVDLFRVMTKFLGSIQQLNLIDIAIPIRASSQAVHSIFPDGSIDILSLDGNHSELASCRDLELYTPKIRAGGYIWADDENWKTTAKMFSILNDKWDRILAVGDCVLYRKK